MKRLLSYLLLCATLLGSSCTKDATTPTGGEGVVCFRIGMDDAPATANASRTYDALQTILIRIYKADGTLVRRYTSLEAMPEDLYLVAGGYRITVEAGDKSAATWTNKSYYGEKEFTIAANRAITEQVRCTPINVGAQVTFDPSVADRLDLGAVVHVMASDAFGEDLIGTSPTLEYGSENATASGYFLLPEGVANLSWCFRGEGTKAGEVEKTGVIENVEAAMIYQLKFQYSKTPDGLADITVTVDKYQDKHYDDVGFSPQPTIKGDGFQMSQVLGYDGNKELLFNVSSLKNLATVALSTGSDTYTIFSSNQEMPEAETEGISYEKIDDKTLKIKITDSFLGQFTTGVYALKFDLTDIDGGKGAGKLTMAVPGLFETTEYDLWSYSASFDAVVIDPTATDVTLAYRTDDGEWEAIPTIANSDYSYSATLAPTWVESRNPANKTIYTMAQKTGFRPQQTYEYCVMANGVPLWTRTLTPEGGDALSTVNDSKLPCYTQSNESEANFWGSGNNSMTSSLCTYSAATEGTKMAPAVAFGTFAPGNLFAGTFAMSGTNGTVSFGKRYDYTARPSALALNYKAKIGTVNYAKHASKIPEGQPDKGRIYVAVIDWTSRHGVTSGLSAPSGTWDPEDGMNAVSEGVIIGYGSFTIEGEIADMTEVSIPIHYYDTEAKPTSGNYTLLISCATSYYGDFLNGCSSNEVFVSNFHWVY